MDMETYEMHKRNLVQYAMVHKIEFTVQKGKIVISDACYPDSIRLDSHGRIENASTD